MTTDTCKNCTQEIVLRDGLWIHNDGDQSSVCELHAEPETSFDYVDFTLRGKPTGYALWDFKYKYTVLFCAECFNERFNASIMVNLAERVNTLYAGGAVANCINCQKAVN